MKKEETKLNIENYLNKFPQVIEPCEMCVNKTDVYAEMCSVCCYFYASHFEIDFSKEIKE